MKNNSERVGYIIGKLEELHTDVSELKEDIALLRKDSISYGVASKVMVVIGGLLAPVVAWFFANHLK